MCFIKDITENNYGPLFVKADRDLVVYKTLNVSRTRILGFDFEKYQSVIQGFKYKKNKLYTTTIVPKIRIFESSYLDSPIARIEINEGFHSFKHLSPCDEQYGEPALFIIPKGAYYMVNHNEGKYITYVSNQIIFKKMISVQERADIVYHEFLNRNNKDNKNK